MQNGFLLALDENPINSPILTVFDSGGNKVFQSSLAVDGVARFQLYDMSASIDGRFAVSGIAYNPSGQFTGMIVYLDQKGMLTRVVRVPDHPAGCLIFAPDGRLWAAGKVVESPLAVGSPDQEIVRVYGPDGKMERTVLRPEMLGLTRNDTLPHSYLAANGSSIVLLDGGRGTLAEITQSDSSISIAPAALPAPSSRATGLSLSSSGDIVMSATVADGSSIAYYRWDRKAMTWVKIYSRDYRSVGYGSILGTQGDAMLVWKTKDPPRFDWLRLAP